MNPICICFSLQKKIEREKSTFNHPQFGRLFVYLFIHKSSFPLFVCSSVYFFKRNEMKKKGWALDRCVLAPQRGDPSLQFGRSKPLYLCTNAKCTPQQPFVGEMITSGPYFQPGAGIFLEGFKSKTLFEEIFRTHTKQVCQMYVSSAKLNL